VDDFRHKHCSTSVRFTSSVTVCFTQWSSEFCAGQEFLAFDTVIMRDY
jgi:hypothetical protein